MIEPLILCNIILINALITTLIIQVEKNELTLEKFLMLILSIILNIFIIVFYP